MSRPKTRRIVRRRPSPWKRTITRDPDSYSRIEAVLKEREEHPEDCSEQTLLDIFLDVPEFASRLHHKYSVFRQFFARSVFERARDGRFELPDEPAVWLHDTSHISGLQSYNGSISLMDFFRLSKPQVHMPRSTNISIDGH